MKRILLLTFMIFSLNAGFAQTGEVTITGTVLDSETGEGIPGATVMVKGDMMKGSITDFNGEFKLADLDHSTILIVSYVGYITKEVPIGDKKIIDISLDVDVVGLEEIVVIGYGTQKKRVVTGAIASVDAKEITETPVLRIEQALQGRTAGVQVTNQSGQPGEEPTIRIRGAGTTGNSRPLYVVDGMVVGGIDFLNPGDIKSMEVLKDAASAAIYGARAANGVVLITTKSGEEGRMQVSYSGYYGIQNVANKIPMLNAGEYRALMNEGARNAGLSEPFDISQPAAHNTIWQDELFQSAPISNQQITVTGGNEKSTYSSSLSYFSQEGIIGGERSQFDRFTARLNTSHKVNPIFNFGNNLSYSHIIRRGIGSNQSFNGAYSSALNMDPLTPVFETDEQRLLSPPYSNEPVVSNSAGIPYGISQYVGAEVVNPLALLQLDNDETRVDKIVGNVYGELEPIEGLKIKSSLGIDMAYIITDGFRPLYYLNGAQLNVDKTSVNKEMQRYFTWQLENTALYSKRVDDHNFSVLVGMTALESKFENLTGFNTLVPVTDPENVYLDLATDTAWTAGGGASHSALFSLFGRVTYDFKDKYAFTGILRRDGSSKFGANNRYGIFPSLGASWIISDENFFPKSSVLNMLKLRASWGVNGNQEIGNYQFVSTIDRTRGYTFGSGRMVGSSPAFIENADIHWEESEQIDIALDFGLFDNRLTGSIDYYIKTTGELLERIPIPAHVGNQGPIANVGSVENRGVEIALSWRSIINDLSYSFSANASYNKNTMTEIGNEEKVLPGASWAIAGQVTRAEVGLPIGYFWGYETDGLFQNQEDIFAHINNSGDLLQPNAVPGDVRFVDVNNDGVIDDDDRTIIGNPTPDWTFGFDGNLSYRSWDFSFLVQGALGNEIFNGTQRQDLRYTNRTTDILDRWTGPNTSNSIPRYTWVDVNNNYRVSDLYIESGSFMRLRNIQIGYNLPDAALAKLGAYQWRFYISAENLFTLTSYNGADPEIGSLAREDGTLNAFDSGIDRGVYPQARTFRIGTTLTF